MIAENLQKLINIKSDIKNAINGKGGSVGERFEDYAPAIENLPSGGVSEEDLGTDTIFVDHTGKIVARFSPEEIMDWTDFSAVTVPEYEGLRFVKFTHTLAEIQNGTWNDVGLCYEPIDGNTHIFVGKGINDETLDIYVGTTAAAQINWGDGNIQVIAAQSSVTLYSHTYADDSDYEIIISGAANIITLGNYTNTYTYRINKVKKVYLSPIVMSFRTMADSANLTEIVFPVNSNRFEISQNLYLGNCQAFVLDTDIYTYTWPTAGRFSGKYICIKKMTSFNAIILAASYSLKSLDMAHWDHNFVSSSSKAPYSLERIKMPDDWEIPDSFLSTISLYNLKGLYGKNLSLSHNSINLTSAYHLNYIENADSTAFIRFSAIGTSWIPSPFLKGTLKFNNLGSIGTRSFQNLTALETIDFTGQIVVPTLSSSAAFSYTNIKFLIPDALYDEWIATTNWSSVYTTNPDRFVRV